MYLLVSPPVELTSTPSQFELPYFALVWKSQNTLRQTLRTPGPESLCLHAALPSLMAPQEVPCTSLEHMSNKLLYFIPCGLC